MKDYRKMADVLTEMETAITPGTEEDLKPQKVNAKKGSTGGQMRKVDIGKEWISISERWRSQHQSIEGVNTRASENK